MTRMVTDEVLALDIRVLARRGYFAAEPGEVASGTERWQHAGHDVGSVDVIYHGDDPVSMRLAYQFQRPDGAVQFIRGHIALARTLCPFGGARWWFVCPGCQRRCALLYGVAGLFRCRRCHDLAYASTRRRPVAKTRCSQGELTPSRGGSVT